MKLTGEATHLIPIHALLPLENAMAYLESRSPLSAALIHRSGSNLCGSGNIVGLYETK